MARHRPEWWAERLDELARGGDAAEIAQRHGVRLKTLRGWRSELARRARTKPAKKPRLLPVVVRPTIETPRAVVSPIEVVVEVGAARMTLRGAVTAEHLAAIVSASARAC